MDWTTIVWFIALGVAFMLGFSLGSLAAYREMLNEAQRIILDSKKKGLRK